MNLKEYMVSSMPSLTRQQLKAMKEAYDKIEKRFAMADAVKKNEAGEMESCFIITESEAFPKGIIFISELIAFNSEKEIIDEGFGTMIAELYTLVVSEAEMLVGKEALSRFRKMNEYKRKTRQA